MARKPKEGHKIYITYGDKTVLRTIRYLNNDVFEWLWGWSTIDKINQNPNKKSKVKWIHKHY